MASTTEFVGFILERLDLLGDVTAKKMFGEYGVYCQGKFFGVICDNRFLIKITEGGQAYLGDYNTDLPYPGGQPMLLIEDLDDKEHLKELVEITCRELPLPKPRKRKK